MYETPGISGEDFDTIENYRVLHEFATRLGLEEDQFPEQRLWCTRKGLSQLQDSLSTHISAVMHEVHSLRLELKQAQQSAAWEQHRSEALAFQSEIRQSQITYLENQLSEQTGRGEPYT
jgi:hypothetical protein